MKTRFNKRKWFRFGSGRKSISVEVSGFDSTPMIRFNIDGGERDFTLAIAFGIAIYLTFSHFLPESWYPTDESKHYGSLPGEREVSLKFHHWALWWCFWKDDSYWSSSDSKLRSGSFNLRDFFIGKHSCKWLELETEMCIASMPEGNYRIEVTKKLRTDSWQRWPSKKSISWEIKAGYYDSEKKWVSFPVPVEGKGENSWDCDEDATYSMSFPAKYGKNIETHQQAAMYFEESMKKSRLRRGGKNWLPKAHKKEGIKFVSDQPVTI